MAKTAKYSAAAESMITTLREEAMQETRAHDATKSKLASVECELFTTKQVLKVEKLDRQDHVESLNRTIEALREKQERLTADLRAHRRVLADMIYSAIESQKAAHVDD